MKKFLTFFLIDIKYALDYYFESLELVTKFIDAIKIKIIFFFLDQFFLIISCVLF